MSFTSMHNDYLDPDKHLWEEEPPCEKCKHDNGSGCRLEPNVCSFEEKEPSKTQVGGDHYTRLSIQPWDVMRSWFGAEAFQAYLLMNALKYIARDKHDKGEDIAKAIHYLQAWQESRK